MTTTISKLSVALTARTDRFNKNMKKSETRLDRFRGKASAVGKALGLMGGVAGGVAAAGMAKLTKDSLSNIDATAKFSDRIGIATEKLVGLEHAAAINGATSKDLRTGLQRMARSIGDAGDGSIDAVRALDALGLKYEDLIGLAPEDQFLAIGDALRDVDNASTRVDLAQTIFGRGGANLLNLMMQGSDSIRSLQGEAERLGLTYSRFEAAKVEAANDAVTRLGAAMRGAGNEAAIGLAPAIEEVANLLTVLASNNSIESFFKGLGDVGSESFYQIAHSAHSATQGVRLLEMQAIESSLAAWRAVANVAAPTGLSFASGINQLLGNDEEAKVFKALTDMVTGDGIDIGFGIKAGGSKIINQVFDEDDRIKHLMERRRQLEKQIVDDERTYSLAEFRAANPIERSGGSRQTDSIGTVNMELAQTQAMIDRLIAGSQSPFERWKEDAFAIQKVFDEGLIDFDRYADAQFQLAENLRADREVGVEAVGGPGEFRNVALENIALNGSATSLVLDSGPKAEQVDQTNNLLRELIDQVGDTAAVLR